QIDPGLDPERLSSFREQVRRLDLYLEVGIPSPNPLLDADRGQAVAEPEAHARGLLPHLDAAVALGCPFVRADIGNRHSRFRAHPSWREQCQAAVAVLQNLKPALRERGLKIALETHADLTTDELLRLIDTVGSDVLGVTLDTGNLLMG